MNEQELMDIEDKGWRDGYDDLMPDYQYEEGTKEYEAYFRGYNQGCQDC